MCKTIEYASKIIDKLQGLVASENGKLVILLAVLMFGQLKAEDAYHKAKDELSQTMHEFAKVQLAQTEIQAAQTEVMRSMATDIKEVQKLLMK